MASTGKGRAVGVTFRPAALIPGLRHVNAADSDVLNDYFWGTGIVIPPAPLQIHLCRLSQPPTLRMEPPYTAAEIDNSSGYVGRARDLAAIFESGVYTFEASLDSVSDDDALNLARFTVTYRAQPQTRAPVLEFDLTTATSDTDRHKLLAAGIGRHVQLLGVPAEFPEGADHLLITGIRHTTSTKRRTLRWTTSGLIGTAPGVNGPWFRWDHSNWDGDHIRPF